MPFDPMNIRKDFPMLHEGMSGKKMIYFDSAATSQKPKKVIHTMSEFYKSQYATVHRAVYEHAAYATECYSSVRRKVKKLINADSEEEIVFTKGTTESLNLIAYSYARKFLKRGDEILISEMEHHSNIIPWQLVCEEIGTKLVIIPMTDLGEIDLDRYKELLSEKTKIVSICHVSNALGTENPVKEIGRLAHEVGAIFIVDGAQAIGHKKIDVKDIGADFYAFSGHKFYGPTGIGVLYGRYELLEKMPPFQGGGDMVEQVTFEKTTFQRPPLKFEAGTPFIVQTIGLGVAIDYFTALDFDSIMEHEQKLLSIATEKLRQFPGVTIYGEAKKKTGIISFSLENVHSLDLGTLISLKGVALRTGTLCAQPTLNHFGAQTLARISFGLYNTVDEVDAFMEALVEVSELLLEQV